MTMMSCKTSTLLLLLLLLQVHDNRVVFVVGYEATWESLDSLPLPTWYDNAKIGIFIHWGAFSVPGVGTEWFWYNWEKEQRKTTDSTSALTEFVHDTERSNFAYVDYGHRFLAELYRPEEWVELFAQSGAQYIVFVSKHHEGYCNFNSKNISSTWNWNCMDIGPRKDLLGELVSALRNNGNGVIKSKQSNQELKFGIYHSAFEWYNPMFLHDQKNNFTTQEFVNFKTLQELYYLVNTYQPEIIWSDGDWMAPDYYWKSKEFLAWLATNSSVKDTVVWNDRWGNNNITCNHGSFVTCHDKYEPPTTLTTKKWEKCISIDKTSWGYNRNSSITQYMSTQELIHNVISSISKNGNILINIGPSSDGTISPIFQDRLLSLGSWLHVNGEAVYNTTSWNVCSNETTTTTTSVFYTRTKDKLYAHVTQWPKGNFLNLSCPEITSTSKAYMLGLDTSTTTTTSATTTTTYTTNGNEEGDNGDDHVVELIPLSTIDVEERVLDTNDSNSRSRKAGVQLHLPSLTPADIPCQHAWVIVLTDIANLNNDDSDRGERSMS